jgi:vacuolar-type H+-ATPase subunit F/Vma7
VKAALHAVGRSAEIRPLLALGAELHEVQSIEQARTVARELDSESVLLLLSDEFAEAETEAAAALVLVLPGLRPGRDPLEMTRELVSRSVGVDLIAKSKRMVRRDG